MANKHVTREFNRERLYKLTKRAVIIVTVVSVLLSIVNYYQIWKGDQDLRLCEQKYSYNLDARVKCGEVPALTMRLAEDNSNTFLTMAFVLPIVFFGGGWLYKYLFPEKKT